MDDGDRSSRSTPVDGFEARMARTLPPATRSSIPDGATAELVQLRLAEECRRYDELVDEVNEDRRQSALAYRALVKETRERVVPTWMRVASHFGYLGFAIAVALLSFEVCLHFGRCR